MTVMSCQQDLIDDQQLTRTVRVQPYGRTMRRQQAGT
eukprot:SAG25_NODE_8648_length_410_cov_40.315113_1_plen_36_part_01